MRDSVKGLLGFTLVSIPHPENPKRACLGLHNGRRQEDQELLFRHGLRFVLEQPPENRDPGQVWHPLHVVGLGIDEHSADHHGLTVANIHLSGSLAPINARTRRIASRTHGIPSGPDSHHDELTGLLRISGGDLRRDIQFEIGIHKRGLSAL